MFAISKKKSFSVPVNLLYSGLGKGNKKSDTTEFGGM